MESSLLQRPYKDLLLECLSLVSKPCLIPVAREPEFESQGVGTGQGAVIREKGLNSTLVISISSLYTVL